jgi:hypothetical protein
MDNGSFEPYMILGLLIAFVVFFVWYRIIREIVQSEFEGPNERLLWLLLVIFLPFLGSFLYLMIGRRSRITDN